MTNEMILDQNVRRTMAHILVDLGNEYQSLTDEILSEAIDNCPDAETLREAASGDVAATLRLRQQYGLPPTK